MIGTTYGIQGFLTDPITWIAVIAVFLVTIFLLVFSTTNALGGIGLMPPFLAAWAPNVLFAGTGVYLLLRTGT